jgi:hypothetical protein
MADKKPTIGETFAGLARQGAKDLHNHIVPAFPAYSHGVDEPGTPLTPYGVTFDDKVASVAAPSPTPSNEQDKGMEL